MIGGARYRDLPLGGSLEATLTKREDGSTLVVSKEPLEPYADALDRPLPALGRGRARPHTRRQAGRRAGTGAR